MEFHLKIKVLRLLNGLSEKQMGAKLCTSGAAYGKMERAETEASHKRINQLTDILAVSHATLTNGEELCLRIYQTEKGGIAYSVVDLKEMERKQNLSDEENQRLRVMLADSQKVNDQWRDSYEAEKKGRKRR